jgi:type I restriction enzyme S subunit
MNMRQNQHEISTSSRFIMPEPGDLKNLIPGNSIIFPKRGGAIATNKKRLVRSPIFVDSNTMAIICPEYIELDYLHIWFLGIDLWDLNSGTSVPQINNKDIGPLVIPVPPLAEQRRIVAKVAQLMALVDQLESHLATARTSAENLMEAIVAELTTQD